MNVREQWQCAWRMARSGAKTGDYCTDPTWMKRPEWIWDRFLGKKLRELPNAKEQEELKRRSEWRMGHFYSLRRARKYEPDRIRSSKHACQKLVAEHKAILAKQSKRQDALRTHLLNLIQWKLT